MLDYTSYGRGMAAGVNPDAAFANIKAAAERRRIAHAQAVSQVLNLYQIKRDEANSLFDRDGHAEQLAWLVVCDANPMDRCVVVFDGAQWVCLDRQCCRYRAEVYIDAVQEYLEDRRRIAAEKSEAA